MFYNILKNDKTARQRLTHNHYQTMVQRPVRDRITLNHNQTMVRVQRPVRDRLSLNHNQTVIRSC
jgi:hypothetical protein